MIRTFAHEDSRAIGVWALIAANLIPLFGVLFFGWNLFSVILLYWLENIVIGIFTVIRMRRSEKPIPNDANVAISDGKPIREKQPLIRFFIYHYSIFTLSHGFFVFALFGATGVSFGALAIGLVSLFFSHTVSYFTNFIGKEEYKHVSPSDLSTQPYKRIFVLHLTILIGGLLSMTIGSPIYALIVLIALKIIVDASLHLREHRSFAKKMEPGTDQVSF